MNLSTDEIERFGQWLRSCGAETISTTNEWEIMRVIAKGETLVAYRDKRNKQTWPTGLKEAWNARSSGFQPQLGNPQGQLRGNRRGRIYEIAERDGWACWYCGCSIIEPGGLPTDGDSFATIEEICPRQIGGPTHIGNQCLACPTCNQEAGNRSVVEKVALRELKRRNVVCHTKGQIGGEAV